MLDHLEQYKHYLDSMKLVRVPVHFKASASGSSILQPVGDPGASQSAANTQRECQSGLVLTISRGVYL